MAKAKGLGKAQILLATLNLSDFGEEKKNIACVFIPKHNNSKVMVTFHMKRNLFIITKFF